MSRPPVSVVMPFAGDAEALGEAIRTLLALDTIAGDQLILADNSGAAAADSEVTIVPAPGERSPAHARNAGALRANNAWILFLDSDCHAPAQLLDAYFAQPIADDIGALAGEVAPAGEAATLAARYGEARSFLSQQAHLAHPYLPRAVAANLLVRRSAFEQLGGFYEGLRAAEDTDFSWRLQRAGWRLAPAPEAAVQHDYRASLRELRAQWRGYAAGRAWLRRRYHDFTPQPAVRRAVSRAWRTVRRSERREDRRRPASSAQTRPRRIERGGHLALDALLGLDELAGLALSNRPAGPAGPPRPTRVVLLADRFPRRGDPLVDFARTLNGARIEAGARPDAPWVEVMRELDIAYREDDGVASRALLLLRLLFRHPLRCARDRLDRGPAAPRLWELAPTVARLERRPQARIHALGGDDVQTTARRLAQLTGRPIEQP